MRLQLTSPVSDPSHERYGQHLSIHEVTDLVKPSDESLDLVHSWLEDNGIPTSHCEYSPAKDWIKISLPINAIENLLDTQYSVFEHSEGGYLVRAPEWSVPKHLHEHITAIQPTTSFFSPQKLGRTFKKVLDISADTPPPSTNNTGKEREKTVRQMEKMGGERGVGSEEVKGSGADVGGAEVLDGAFH